MAKRKHLKCSKTNAELPEEDYSPGDPTPHGGFAVEDGGEGYVLPERKAAAEQAAE